MLHMDEESFMSRFEKVRGFQFNLTETVHTVTAELLDMPVKRRKLYPGTNPSNVLGPIALLPYTAEHHNMVIWKDKKDVWSASCKIACRVGGAGPEGAEKTERKPDTVEPLTYHGYNHKVWTELLHSHNASAFIDFTVGAGYAAEAAMHLKLPYVGFVQTALHETLVRRHLFRRMWDLMNQAGSLHYEPQLPALLKSKDSEAKDSKTTDGKHSKTKDQKNKHDTGKDSGGKGKDDKDTGKDTGGKSKDDKDKAAKTETKKTISKKSSSGKPADEGLMGAIKKLASLKQGSADKDKGSDDDDGSDSAATDPGADE